MLIRSFLLAALLALPAFAAQAHCDSMDGPVVRDARLALSQNDVTPVLKWVRKQDEAQVRDAFQRAVIVRAQGDAARDLADQFFFETLVRIHRAGEGEPYTGLKPAGSIDPGIAKADKALDEGSGKMLAVDLGNAVQAAVRARYKEALERRAKAAPNNVAAQRAYVGAYVDYIHFIEQLNRLVSEGPATDHGADGHDGHDGK